MQHETMAPAVHVSRSGICVVDGYGVELRVERGQLVVADGIGDRRRRSTFGRATGGLRRLVLLGHTGYLSLDALRWITDTDVALIVIDPEGRLLVATGTRGLNEPALRRAQASALGSPVGNEIARSLLRRKLEGQARIAESLAALGARDLIRSYIENLDNAHAPAELLVPEATAANSYWSAWAKLRPAWATRDAVRVPAHWRTFGTRASPLTGNPRLAANPPNAILNYLYSLLEAEARLACLAVGLDPGLGVLHQDAHARDSLALDLMEVVRPEVDAFVLELLGRTWRLRDFHETRKGACRLLEPLTHELALTLDRWRWSIGPVAEDVAAMLTSSRASSLPTPLTQRRRSAGRVAVRRRQRSLQPKASGQSGSCRECGAPTSRGRRYCIGCRPGVESWRSSGTEALAAARDSGIDPAHGGEVARIRGEKWRQRRRLEAEWERGHGTIDPDRFRQQILPQLEAIATRRLVEATGMTRAYCAKIKRGEVIPHARWWQVLEALIAPTPG